MFKTIFSSFLLIAVYINTISCKCPAPATVENFDLSRYLGNWYEVQRFPFFFENDLKCVTAQYTVNNDNTVKVNNSGINELTQKFSEAIGKATIPNSNDPSKLAVTFGSSIFSFAANYWIVKTDYTSYSLVYSCTSVLGINFQYAWILSRTKSLDQNLVDSLRDHLQTNGIDAKKFIVTDQTNCD